MSQVHKILAKKQYSVPGYSSNHSSPRTSPGLRRHVLNRKKGGNSSSSSKESLNDSSDRVTSLEDLHWIGEPEAIHSVRRPRKTVEEQELELEINKLRVS